MVLLGCRIAAPATEAAAAPAEGAFLGESALVAGSALENTVTQIMEMGFPREQVRLSECFLVFPSASARLHTRQNLDSRAFSQWMNAQTAGTSIGRSENCESGLEVGVC